MHAKKPISLFPPEERWDPEFFVGLLVGAGLSSMLELGMGVGAPVATVGIAVGAFVGRVGVAVGALVAGVGEAVGTPVGDAVGDVLGATDGDTVGDAVMISSE